MAKRFGYDCPDFVGEELTFGRRAEATNISPVKAKSFWAGENVLYGLEREVILKELKKEAEELVRKFKEAGSLNWDIVLQKWDSLEKQIKASYIDGDKKLTTGKEEYTKKNLHKSYNVGIVFKILTIVFILIELIVMVGSSIAQGLEGGYSSDFLGLLLFGVLFAVFLAGGGWLVGMFLSAYMFDRHLKVNGIGEKELVTVVHWLLLIGGLLLILFVSFSRLPAGGFGLFLFTMLLGLIISAMKALWDYYDGLKCFVGSLRVFYFKEEASRKHENAILSDYKNIFYNEVEHFARKENVNIERKTIKEG